MATKKLTKADILAAEDRATEDVDVPEWGGEVTIRALSGAEREEWQLSQVKVTVGSDGDLQRVPKLDGAQVRLVQMSIVDGDKPMFSKAEVAALGDKSATALERVFTAAIKLNGLSDEAVGEAGKDSEMTPNGEPGTD